ncbi:MAG: phosphotransferase [Clostridia bacterium]|nr:phosphotransferase [Clostridia bacterium]
MSKKFNFRSLTPINAGWSGDKKYCAVGNDGSRYFLRIAPPEKADKAKKAFELQKKIFLLGVPMCEPLDCGECEEGFFILQSWIDGENAEDAVRAMSEKEQYALGLDAGAILKTIHTVPAPPDAVDWETRFNAKIDRKIKLWRECPIKPEGGEAFYNYIEKNRALLRGRPQSFQHGDYHIGNMMIAREKLFIIDFDRFDHGDPWEEFNRIVWCAQAAPGFARGMIDGYFPGGVPESFWRLLALYISSNSLSSVPWAIPFGEEQINVFLKQLKEVLSWYDDMTKVIPSWYEKK